MNTVKTFRALVGAVLLSISSLYAESLPDPNIGLAWAGTFNGAKLLTTSAKIATDETGNIYIAGVAESQSGVFDFKFLNHGGSNPNPSKQAYIAKYDLKGQLLFWENNLLANVNSEVTDIKVINNFVYITGYFTGSGNFNVRYGTPINLTSAGSKDVFFGKYNLDLSPVWVKNIGSSGDESATSIDVDNAGNVYLAGTFAASTSTFCPNADSASGYLPNMGGSGNDLFFAKYNTNGKMMWAYSLGTNADESVNMDVDYNGNVFVSGHFAKNVLGNTMDCDASTGNSFITTSTNNYCYLIKYNTSGEFQWANRLGGLNSKVLCGTSGEVIVYGEFTGDGTGKAALYSPYDSLTSATTVSRGFVARYFDNGSNSTFNWVKAFGIDDSFTDEVTGLSLDGFDADIIWKNGDDISVSKIESSNGNNNIAFSITTGRGIQNIHVDNKNNIFITGATNATSDFDPSAVVKTVPSGYFIAKYFQAPAIQESNLKVDLIRDTMAVVSWQRGSADSVLVFVAQDNTGAPGLSNHSIYSANSRMGSGSSISNFYCVYKGKGNQATVTNLAANTNYRFYVAGYNSNAYALYYNTTVGMGDTMNIKTSVAPENALVFDGTNDYLKLPSIAGIRAVSMWVYRNSSQPSSPYYLIDARDGLAAGYIYSWHEGGGFTKLYVNGTIQPSPALGYIPTDRWSHVYLEADASFTDDMNIFSRNDGAETMKGKLDELAVWSSPLSETEIKTLMYISLPSNTPDLLAYYTFNQTSGTSVSDQKNTYNATMTNMSGSEWQTSTAQLTPILSKPTEVSPAGFRISWSKVPGIFNYTLEYDESSDFSSVISIPALNDTTYFINVSPGSITYYRVRSQNPLVSDWNTGSQIQPMQVPGNALAFDGMDDYVNSGNLTQGSITELTIETWVKLEKTGTQYICFKPGEFAMGFDGSTKIFFNLADGGGWGSGFGSLTPTATNQWNHIAIVWKSDTAKLFINGLFVRKDFFQKTPVISTNQLVLGTAEGNYLGGQIDEFRIWNTARTPAQIWQGLHEPVDPASSGLLLYYNFDRLSGTTVVNDLSPNGFNGTLMNMSGTAEWQPSKAIIKPFIREKNMLNESIQIAWDKIPNATSYTVACELPCWGGGCFSNSPTTSDTSYTFSGLYPDSTYHVSVEAKMPDLITSEADIHFIKTYNFKIDSAKIDSVTCDNSSDGKVKLFLSGGVAPYSLSYYNGSNINITGIYNDTISITGLPAGEYFFEVTDAVGNATAQNVEVLPKLFYVYIMYSEVSGCVGIESETMTLYIEGGTAPFTYSWYSSQSGIFSNPEGDTTTYTPDISGSHYIEVTVTDNKGCTTIGNLGDGFYAYQLPEVSIMHNYVKGDTSLNLSLVTSGDDLMYSWSVVSGTANASNFSNTLDREPMFHAPFGTYILRCTVSNSCGMHYDDYQLTMEQDPLRVGLTAWYKFEGDASDASGNNNNGVVYGATPVTDRFGNYNNAYSFDGYQDWITIPSGGTVRFPQGESFSISIMAKLEPNSGTYFNNSGTPTPFNGGALINRYGCTQGYKPDYIMMLYDGSNKDSLYTSVRESSSADFNTFINNIYNTYHLYTIIRNSQSATLQLYVDNVLIRTVSFPVNGDNNSDIETWIGKAVICTSPQPFNDVFYFKGIMDEVRIYKRALSQSDIDSLYYQNYFALFTKQNSPILSGLAGTKDTLVVNSNGAWTITNVPTWASLSQTSGNGNDTVFITLQAYMGTGTRQQSLYLNGNSMKSYYLSQKPALETGLVAWYPFNGNAMDESGNYNNGTVNGATPTTDRFGNPSGALYFDGNDKVVCNKPFLNGPFTVSIWAKVNNPPPGIHMGCLFSNGYMHGTLGNGFGVLIDPTATVFFKNPVSTGFQNNNYWSFNNNFYLLTYTWDGTTNSNAIRVFINDSLVGTGACNSAVINATDNLTFGLDNTSTYWFGGSLDDIRIYNRALSAQEVSELFCPHVPKPNLGKDSLNIPGTQYMGMVNMVMPPVGRKWRYSAVSPHTDAILPSGSESMLNITGIEGHTYHIICRDTNACGNSAEDTIVLGFAPPPYINIVENSISVQEKWPTKISINTNIPGQLYVVSKNENIAMANPGLGVWGVTAGTTYVTAQESIGKFYPRDSVLVIVTDTFPNAFNYNGTKYHWVKIGNRLWFKENLNTYKYNDNTSIDSVFSYSNIPQYARIYGNLYKWNVVNSGKICPAGWRVPTVADWQALATEVSNDGKKLMSKGKYPDGGGYWNSGLGNDQSGLMVFPSGNRDLNGNYGGIYDYSSMWSSNAVNADTANGAVIFGSDGTFVPVTNYAKNSALAVRCVRDTIFCTPPIATAGPDQLNVTGAQVSLAANNPGGVSRMWYNLDSVSNGGSFGNRTIENTQFNGQPGKSYRLVWSLTNTCGTSKDTVIVSFKAMPMLTHPFFEKVNYTGAIGKNDWMAGWTSFNPQANVYNNPTEVISGNITSNRILKTGKTYQLDGWVYVKSGATLFIEPGVVVRANPGTKASLFVEKGAKIFAVGTVSEPIVFTSGSAQGSRQAGDWGGVHICGNAKTNLSLGVGLIEGTSVEFGGTNDLDNSGSLQYVRIEYAGADLDPGNGTNGLTMAAIGSRTTIDHIQVSYCNDDAFEFFGGMVHARYLVSYATVDDDFDDSNGSRAKIQFAAAIRDKNLFSTGKSHMVESDNNSIGDNATPQSANVYSNLTMIGPKVNTSDIVSTYFDAAVYLRKNTATQVHNSLITGYNTGLYVINSPGVKLSYNQMAGVNNTATDDTSAKYYPIPSNKTLISINDLKITDPFNTTYPNLLPLSGSPAANSSMWFTGDTTAKPAHCPTPDFSFVVAGNQVIFNNLSSAGYQYNWSFGDASTSNQFSPVYTYAQGGTYRVALQLIDSAKVCGNVIYKEVALICEQPFSNAGSDTTITSGVTSISLKGIKPLASRQEKCQWYIVSGTGGSFANDTVYNTSFTGVLGQTYQLRMRMYNSCGEDNDTVKVTFACNPTYSVQNITNCGSYTWPVSGKTYTTSGIYKDTLINVAGCDSIITLNLTVKQTTSATQTMVTCGNYTWPISGKTYTTSGIYKDTLINVAGCDSIITLNLTINTPPLAIAGVDQLNLKGKVANLTANNPLGTTRLWYNLDSATNGGSFGNRATGTTQFTGQPGKSYRLVWTISKDGCTGKDTVFVSFKEIPVCHASFAYTVDKATRVVSFINNSTPADQYYWEFGDYQADTAKAPAHTYNREGFYQVCLSAYNSQNECFADTCGEVKVEPQDQTTFLFADYTYEVTSKTVQFRSASSANTSKWYWTFGDGGFSVSPDPVHTYYLAGRYNVCLKVFDTKTGKSAQKCNEIEVGDPPCNTLANYGYVVEGLTVKLSNKSKGNVKQRFWEFGDGQSSASESPTYTFKQAGYYLVSLAVSDSTGKCNDVAAELIQVGKVECKASFTASVDGQTASFTNTSLGNPDKYYWNFSDGSGAISANTSHSFDGEGVFKVSLTISASNGLCVDNYEEPVQVGSAECHAVFSYFVDSAKREVRFINKSFGNNTISMWSFGDGSLSVEREPVHTYSKAGFYNVTLNTYNPKNACMDQTSELILAGDPGADCEAGFIYQTEGRKVNFTDRSKGDIAKYSWSFGDNSALNPEKSPTYNYTRDGVFNVCLKVENTNGISNITCGFVVVKTTEIIPCQADFVFNADSLSRKVRFRDQSLGKPDSWEWDFGNGNTSVKKVDSLVYAAKGYYLVGLTIRNSQTNCKDRTFKLVNVAELDVLKAAYGKDPKGFSQKAGGYPVDFIGTGIGDQAKLRWDFGDDSINESSPTPTHTYTKPGNYTVCYTVTDPVTGKSDKACDTIDIPESCGFELATPSAVCKNITIKLDAQGKANIKPGDIDGGSSDNCQDINLSASKSSFTTANLGSNIVVLTVTDGSGNTTICNATVQVELYSGIDEINNISQIKVYPNPFSESLGIEYQMNTECEIQIVLTTIEGRVVETIFKGKNRKGNNKLNYSTGNLAKGIYMVQFSTSKGYVNNYLVVKE